MNDTPPTNWHGANQRYLTARLSVVREALERHAARGREIAEEESDKTTEATLRAAALALPAPSALDFLCGVFSLSSFERDVLLLCAGMELDSVFAQLCAASRGSPQHAYPTFSLALAALPEAHWSALTPAGALRRWRLIEVGAGDTLVNSQLRIDERVLHYLTGISYLDARLQGLIESPPPPADLPPSHRELALRLADFWSRPQKTLAAPVIHLCGGERAAKHAIAAFACAARGIKLHILRAADVPAIAAEREALIRLWEREAVLSSSALFLDCDEPDNKRAVLSFVENMHGMLLVSSREPLPSQKRRTIRVDVDKPSAAEQQSMWQEALGPMAPGLNGQLAALVSQFSLSAQTIQSACADALSKIEDDNPSSSILGPHLSNILWDACRVQARSRLDDLAQRIETVADWNDLVLPEGQLQTLRGIGGHVQQRAKVYENWGFASKGSRGLGISALFAGESGTGKTMAAEVLAQELRLDLYRIDLSSVVSKYIGETEKNLRRVFDAAEDSGAILLFDEADALFGKRSEVRDSHDRYANIEVSYLLQRMEAYRGLAILTTNMKSALDVAFQRRLSFVVQFPFPDQRQREQIWRGIFPVATPIDAIDYAKLAKLNMSGGSIRNVALNSAFLAAAAGEPVRMAHLLQAAHSEAAKRERPLSDAETRGWV
jgi:ATPase family associated with various cellular activities (AAA)